MWFGWKQKVLGWFAIAVGALGIFVIMAYGLRTYARMFEARPSFATEVSGVSPRGAIGISFATTLRNPDEFAESVRIEPKADVAFEWTDGGRKLLVRPVLAWDAGISYRISTPHGRTKFFGDVLPTELTFTAWRPPRVLSVSPGDGMTDVFLGIEDPIIVVLDRSASDAYLDFRLNGEEASISAIGTDRSEFRILPKDPRAGERYALEVRARHRGDIDAPLTTLFSGSFSTLPPPPAEWAVDFPTRLEQAKRYTIPAVRSGKHIDIDLRHQVMTLFEDGRAIDAYMVSSGKSGMDTPKGEYLIRNKALRPWSSAYGLYMPHWMALVPSGKYGIHELPEWPGGYKEGANHLGTPVSHGCVRLGVGAAERVYAWTEVGTPVRVH